MSLPTPFTAVDCSTTPGVSNIVIATPRHDFDHLGALKDQGEDEGDFDDYCSAIRIVNEHCESSVALSDAIATRLNRAHAHGAANRA